MRVAAAALQRAQSSRSHMHAVLRELLASVRPSPLRLPDRPPLFSCVPHPVCNCFTHPHGRRFASLRL